MNVNLKDPTLFYRVNECSPSLNEENVLNSQASYFELKDFKGDRLLKASKKAKEYYYKRLADLKSKKKSFSLNLTIVSHFDDENESEHFLIGADFRKKISVEDFLSM